MRSSVRSCLQLALLLLSQSAGAEAPLPADSAPTPTEASGGEENAVARLESELHFKSGDVALGENLATLHLGDALRYLGPEDTEKVLVAWGNPAGSKSLGMLLPNQISLFADESWAVIVAPQQVSPVVVLVPHPRSSSSS